MADNYPRSAHDMKPGWEMQFRFISRPNQILSRLGVVTISKRGEQRQINETLIHETGNWGSAKSKKNSDGDCKVAPAILNLSILFTDFKFFSSVLSVPLFLLSLSGLLATGLRPPHDISGRFI